MPTREQLIGALREADSKGNFDDAKQLAEMIKAMPKDAANEPSTAETGITATGEPEQEESFLSKASSAASKISQPFKTLFQDGGAEAALQMASSTIAEPVSGLVGLGAGLMPGDHKAGDVVKSVQDFMTIDPFSEAGKAFMPDLVNTVLDNTPDMIKKGVNATGESFSQLEEWTLENLGPEAATALSTLPTALLEIIPAGLAARKVRQAGKAAQLPEPAMYGDAVPLSDKPKVAAEPEVQAPL